MLNESDLQYMRTNREALVELRTTPVTLERQTVTGTVPYTGEPITTVNADTVMAIVKGFTGQVGGERLFVNGVAIESGDVQMTFNYTTDLNGVQAVWHDGVKYVLFSVQPKGIGYTNRFECIARRAT
jgi:hypothetical protein